MRDFSEALSHFQTQDGRHHVFYIVGQHLSLLKMSVFFRSHFYIRGCSVLPVRSDFMAFGFRNLGSHYRQSLNDFLVLQGSRAGGLIKMRRVCITLFL